MIRRKSQNPVPQEPKPEISGTAYELAIMAEQRLGELAVRGGDIPAGIEQIINELTDTRRIKMMKEAFEALPMTERLGFLARTFDNDRLRELFAAENALAHEKAELQVVIDRLRFEAKNYYRVDLSRIPEGHSLQVNLHSMADYRAADMNIQKFQTGTFIPDMMLMLAARGNGRFRILELAQNPDGPVLTHDFSLQQVIALGSGSGDDAELVIHFGANLSSGTDGETWKPLMFGDEPAVVNHVAVNGQFIHPYGKKSNK